LVVTVTLLLMNLHENHEYECEKQQSIRKVG
jgi:hypothetical protein